MQAVEVVIGVAVDLLIAGAGLPAQCADIAVVLRGKAADGGAVGLIVVQPQAEQVAGLGLYVVDAAEEALRKLTTDLTSRQLNIRL